MVPENQRSEGKFNVLIKARDLVIYTIQICSNENIFIPKYQNALTDDIIQKSKDIFISLYGANEIKVTDKLLATKRMTLQKEAILYCNELLAEIQLAKSLFHLKSKRIAYWGAMILEVRKMTSSWHQSDCKRYKDIE